MDELPTINVVGQEPTIEGYGRDFAEIIVPTTEVADRIVVMFEASDDDPDLDDETEPLPGRKSGPDAGDFTILGGVLTFVEEPNFEKPADADKDNVYVVTVAATDSDNNRGEKSVEVRVTNVNEAGTVRLSAVSPRVGVPLTASLTDLDGGVHGIKWQWSNDDPDNADNGGLIDGATSDTYKPTSVTEGILTVTASYSDAQGSYSDPEAEAEARVMKMAEASTPVVGEDTRNKAPKFPDQDTVTDGTQNTEAERTIAENATGPLNGGAVTAEDEGDTLTYTLGGTDAASFRVMQDDADSMDVDEGGQIVVPTGTKLDYETKQTYMVTVTATDSFGVSASIDVTIRVTDENEGPEISVGGLAISGRGNLEYAENGTDPVAVFTAVDPENKGAAVWSLKSVAGDDASLFTIDRSSGELSFKKSPNYEAPKGGAMGGSNTYMVTVVARDVDGVVTEEEVTIEVTNVNEAGKISFSALAPHPGVPLTAKLSDSDGVVNTSKRWEWSRSLSKSGSYTAIADAEAESYTPTSGDVRYYLRATVSYRDREGAGKSAVGTSANEVKAINSPNPAPVFPDQDPTTPELDNMAAMRMVGENAEVGDNVGDPVKAADANRDILTYTIGDTTLVGGGTTDDVSFKINAATGQITVGADPELDADEEPTEYMVIVTATDPGDESSMITVTITVTDDLDELPTINVVGQEPTIEGYGRDFAEIIVPTTEVADRIVVMFEASDDDPDLDDENRTFAWSKSGPDAGDFTILGGVLTFVEEPNFEKPADADKDNVYVVTVAATDSDNNRGEKSVEVRVTNVNEAGTVRLSAVSPRVGVPLTASLTDLDGGVHGIKWQWSNDDPDNADNGGLIGGATSDTYKPTSVTEGILTVTASYSDAQGSYSDPEAEAEARVMKMAEASTPVVGEDTRNKAPKFPDQDTVTDGTQNTEAERTIAENATGPLNGGAVTAEDEGDTLTYTLGGTDAASFRVMQDDADSMDVDEGGQIVVPTGTKLDYETKQTYMVTVTATGLLWCERVHRRHHQGNRRERRPGD